MTNPPFGLMTCPVIKSDFSLERNKMAFEISSGVPSLCIGVWSIKSLIESLLKCLFISVFTTPGATQFTCIPEGPSSLARDRVKPIIAALEAE